MTHGKHAIVVGASGFIGSAVCDELTSVGWKVDRWSRSQKPGYNRIDLTNSRAVHDGLLSSGANFIINCAGSLPSNVPAYDLVDYVESESAPTLSLIAAARVGELRGFIQIGSAAEYGPIRPPQGPGSEEAPRNVYGVQKLATTRAALAMSSDSFAVTVLRPFTVYGPSQKPGMLIPDALQAAESGAELLIGDPHRVRDWIHVHDVARAVMAALDILPSGVALPVGSGIPHSVSDVLELVSKLTGRELRWKESQDARPHDIDALIADAPATQEAIGWQAAIDLETGLRTILGSP